MKTIDEIVDEVFPAMGSHYSVGAIENAIRKGIIAGLEAAKAKVDEKTTEAIANYRQTRAMYDDGLSDGFDQSGQVIDQLIKEARND